MPHIFEPFYSGGDVMQHSSGTAGFEKRGMGLGLAVVRHFIELHGGSVSVSTGARGSTFTVTVPMEAPARTERPERPRPEGGPGA
jgi:signal transduction histidine kinase